MQKLATTTLGTGNISQEDIKCEICIQAKMVNLPFSTNQIAKSSYFGEVIHSDICGPITPKTSKNHQYFATFLDDFTGYLYIAVLARKSDIYTACSDFISNINMQIFARKTGYEVGPDHVTHSLSSNDSQSFRQDISQANSSSNDSQSFRQDISPQYRQISSSNDSQSFPSHMTSSNYHQPNFIRQFHSDNAKEYLALASIFKKLGITHSTSAPYTPEENGKAERINRTILDKTRSLIYQSNIPKKYWNLALQSAVYLYNRTPNYRDITPFESRYGSKPNLANIRIFGSLVYRRNPLNIQISKLAPRSSPFYLVGYIGQNIYLLLDIKTGRTTSAKHVEILESRFYKDSKDLDILDI
jgi:hypothetical protein